VTKCRRWSPAKRSLICE